MFQQWLDLDTRAPVIYAGLHPTGGPDDPCVVKCRACTYHDTAATWTAAVRLAIAHDWQHDKQQRRVSDAKNDRD